jgi:protein SCO1
MPINRYAKLGLRTPLALAHPISAWLDRITAAALITALCFSAARSEELRLVLDHTFTLVDAEGKTVASTDFADKWLLIYFGYTHCSDQCPTALSAMAEALDEIGPAARHVQPLFITVDPERDCGPILKEFTAAFDKRMIGLTGTQEQIADIGLVLGVKYEKVLLGSSNYVVDHSNTFSVVDPSGRSGVTFAVAEPYLVAARLLELLDRSGMVIPAINNLGAYR